MKRILPCLLLALTLTGCGPMLAAMGGAVAAPPIVQTVSAPLAQTRVDETALRALWNGLDAIASAVDGLVATRVLVRNTPAALRVRAGLSATRDALNAADDLAQQLNNPVQTLSPAEITQKLADYRSTIRRVQTAFDELRAAIRER